MSRSAEKHFSRFYRGNFKYGGHQKEEYLHKRDKLCRKISDSGDLLFCSYQWMSECYKMGAKKIGFEFPKGNRV